MELIKSKEEIWKPIDDYETYSVSTLGKVRNDETMWIFKGSKTMGGYLNVVLRKNGVKKNHYIHRLVALAFIPNPDNKPCVDHRNNNKTDNRVESLRWCTHQENGMNQQLSSVSISGIKGVIWNKQNKKWEARIVIDGLKIRLGLFDSKEDAREARQTRANEAFGVFTNLCETMDC